MSLKAKEPTTAEEAIENLEEVRKKSGWSFLSKVPKHLGLYKPPKEDFKTRYAIFLTSKEKELLDLIRKRSDSEVICQEIVELYFKGSKKNVE